MRGIRTPAV